MLPRSVFSRWTSLVALVAFVGGGVLGPVLHRVHHAPRPAAPTTDACDHAGHGDAFEAVHAALHDDVCVLCSRHLTYLASLAAPLFTPHHFASYAPAPSRFMATERVGVPAARAPPAPALG